MGDEDLWRPETLPFVNRPSVVGARSQLLVWARAEEWIDLIGINFIGIPTGALATTLALHVRATAVPTRDGVRAIFGPQGAYVAGDAAGITVLRQAQTPDNGSQAIVDSQVRMTGFPNPWDEPFVVPAADGSWALDVVQVGGAVYNCSGNVYIRRRVAPY